MNELRITCVQSILHWEDIQANLAMFREKLVDLKGKTDIIILPEMFTSGFSMSAKHLAETMDGKAIEWMKEMAGHCNAVVTGSLIIQEGAHYYNRLIWMEPDGNFSHYDKRHLFALAKEDEVYTAGTKKLIIEWKGWKICPLICYDLRFPVWARNVEHYDLLIYMANWPVTRVSAWSTLLKARAIENQVYTVGVNRCGEDVFVKYSGASAVIDYAGEALYQVSNVENVSTISLSKEKQTHFRSKLAFLDDRDEFYIKNLPN